MSTANTNFLNPNQPKKAPSVISSSHRTFVFDADRHHSRGTSSTKFTTKQMILFAMITMVILSHNLHSTYSFPLLPPSSLQNWWNSKFNPPPETTSTQPEDSELNEFELIKPRLSSLAEEDSERPAEYDKIPSINTRRKLPSLSSGEETTKPSTFLLTFITRDQTAYSATLKEEGDQDDLITLTTSNPYSENVIPSQQKRKPGCRHYHGQLVTPSKGHLSATTCPGNNQDLALSATIMLTSGKVLLIRPLMSSSKTSRKSTKPEVKAYAIRRRGDKRPLLPGSLKNSTCYMSEYEKRHISLEWMTAKGQNQNYDHQQSQPENKTTNENIQSIIKEVQKSTMLTDNTENEKPFLDPENIHQGRLIHQFGRHYLYRVSSDGGAPGISKKYPHVHLKPGKAPIPSNYSSCTERYIGINNFDDGSSEDLLPTKTPPKMPPPVTEAEITETNPYSDDDDYVEESSSAKPTDYDEDYEEDTTTKVGLLHRQLISSNKNIQIRSKRELSKDDVYSKTFTIETVIFVDGYLLNRFNGNRQELQRLILAIMNEVQLIFNFDSLKIRVRILIKQIRYLEGKEAPSSAEGDIDQYLDNFCAWQKRLWLGANRTARWDHALMLTGLDLYKRVAFNKKNRKVLGLAWVNGMCRPAYSCTLNEGKNFEAAYVIAHEMAHSLGMLHDGYDNNCDPERYIMSEKTGPGKINWSPCSNLYLENFLTKSNMRCLESTRADQIKRFSDPFDAATDTRLPGEQYSLNEQCELALGKGYKAYTSAKAPFQDVCRELWCSSGTWATPAHPALEGSTCSRRKSCYQGTCVDKQRAFAQSKIKMYNNRRPTDSPPPGRLSVSGGGGGNGSASNGTGGPSFMRRVQRFLRSTIRSVVGFFG